MSQPQPFEQPAEKSLATNVRWGANPVRSIVICAIGAIIGLGVAGFGLFTAKGTSSHAVPPEDVALVNNRPILVTDFTAQLENEFNIPISQATREQRQKVLNDMLREELFVQRGLELDMPSSDPDTRTALVAAVEQQVVIDATSQQPSVQQLMDYYGQHKDKYSTEGTVSLVDLIPAAAGGGTAALTNAQAASAALQAGQPLPAVMAKYSLRDSGKVDGEEFYFAAKIHLGDKVFALARQVDDGKASAAVTAEDGAPHVIVMRRNVRPQLETFEEARPSVLNDYKKDVETRLQVGELKYLHDKADIRVAKAYQ